MTNGGEFGLQGVQPGGYGQAGGYGQVDGLAMAGNPASEQQGVFGANTSTVLAPPSSLGMGSRQQGRPQGRGRAGTQAARGRAGAPAAKSLKTSAIPKQARKQSIQYPSQQGNKSRRLTEAGLTALDSTQPPAGLGVSDMFGAGAQGVAAPNQGDLLGGPPQQRRPPPSSRGRSAPPGKRRGGSQRQQQPQRRQPNMNMNALGGAGGLQQNPQPMGGMDAPAAAQPQQGAFGIPAAAPQQSNDPLGGLGGGRGMGQQKRPNMQGKKGGGGRRGTSAPPRKGKRVSSPPASRRNSSALNGMGPPAGLEAFQQEAGFTQGELAQGQDGAAPGEFGDLQGAQPSTEEIGLDALGEKRKKGMRLGRGKRRHPKPQSALTIKMKTMKIKAIDCLGTLCEPDFETYYYSDEEEEMEVQSYAEPEPEPVMEEPAVIVRAPTPPVPEYPSVFWEGCLTWKDFLIYILVTIVTSWLVWHAPILHFWLAVHTLGLTTLLNLIHLGAIAMGLYVMFYLHWRAVRIRFKAMEINGRQIHFFGDQFVYYPVWLFNLVLTVSTLGLWNIPPINGSRRLLGWYLDTHLCYRDELDPTNLTPMGDRRPFIVVRAHATYLAEIMYWYVNPATFFLFDGKLHPWYWDEFFLNAEFGGVRLRYAIDTKRYQEFFWKRAFLNRIVFWWWSDFFSLREVVEYHDSRLQFDAILAGGYEKNKFTFDQGHGMLSEITIIFSAHPAAWVRIIFYPIRTLSILFCFWEFFSWGVWLPWSSFFQALAEYVIAWSSYNRLVVRGRGTHFYGNFIMAWIITIGWRFMTIATCGLWALFTPYPLYNYFDDHMCSQDDLPLDNSNRLHRRWVFKSAYGKIPLKWRIIKRINDTFGCCFFGGMWLTPSLLSLMTEHMDLGGIIYNYTGNIEEFKPWYMQKVWFKLVCLNKLTEHHDQYLDFVENLNETSKEIRRRTILAVRPELSVPTERELEKGASYYPGQDYDDVEWQTTDRRYSMDFRINPQSDLYM